MKVLVYSIDPLNINQGLGNVALNISKNLPFEQKFLSLGRHRKLLFYSFFSVLYFFVKAIQIKPDVVFVHSTEASFDPVIVRKLFGLKFKIVCVGHGTYYGLYQEYRKEIKLGNTKPRFTFVLNLKLSIFRSRFVKYCDSVTSVSSLAKRELKSIYGVDSFLIPNGVEDNFFNSKLNRNSSASNRILFVGNQFWLKGLHYLVKANELLPSPQKIIVVGLDESQKKELCGLVDCGYVEFKKNFSRKELFKEYSKGGVYAMPSVYESFGIVYLEAMCFGMPVVASKKTGAEDFIVDGKNGFLADKRDPQSIAMALLSAQKLCGKVPKPSKKFLWKNISKEYEKIILRVLT